MPKPFFAGDAEKLRARNVFLPLAAVIIAVFSIMLLSFPDRAAAQDYSFTQIVVKGNQRIPADSIVSYAGIARGKTVTSSDLNDAYQHITDTGLFQTVELKPQGSKLEIDVVEFPTISRINFEGNKRIKDDDLTKVIKSKERQIYSPSQAEADAAAISEAYAQQGRLAAKVTPRVIRRSDNRVDLVFEVFEGGNTEVQRISFVGNKDFSDRRLRQVLTSKQANFLHELFTNDTLVADRIDADKQKLIDFYKNRGYVDMRVTGVDAQLSPNRNGYVVTFNIEEGQKFHLGQITTVSKYPGVDSKPYSDAVKIKTGDVYSPDLFDNTVERMERLAVQQGLDFLRVEPKVTRNDRDMTLDVEFDLTKGPRKFIQRIDIEGNTTTLDRVIRAEFKVAEGDPYNPREIREATDRLKALGYFTDVKVNAKKGTRPDQVIIDVNVVEKPTGSFSLGGTYSTTDGFGVAVSFSENNFLGRGQTLGVTLSGATSDKVYSARFVEPHFLGRDLAFHLKASYEETDSEYATYDTKATTFGTGLTFPAGENAKLGINYTISDTDIMDNDDDDDVGPIIQSEIDRPKQIASAVGYDYTYDTRLTGLNPNAGYVLKFGQDVAGLGGDARYVKTSAQATAQTKLYNEQLTLRAKFSAGMINSFGGYSTLVTDRYRIGGSYMRGFTPSGIGPRQRASDGSYDDAIGGTAFAAAQFDAEFPLGLPTELGLTGGVFTDIGTSWGVDGDTTDVIYDDGPIRWVVGVSLFWTTPIGPLRFNFSKALKKETYDDEQQFDLTLNTSF